MADGGESHENGPVGRPATDRERFLTFALTAADMLLEVSPDGRIEFAAGAFQNRMGEPAEAWLGRRADRMVVLSEQAEFEAAFGTLLARDRLPPTSFRLSDAARTPISVAGLRMPAPPGAARGAGRFCLTVSSLPKQQPRPSPALAGGDAVRAAALRRADGVADVLSFIEVAGPDGLPPAEGPVAAAVEEALSTALPGDSVAGELSAGRYGLVSHGAAADLAGLGAQIQDAVRGAGLEATVETRSLPLQADGLTPVQRTRALRFAFDAFARGGQGAVEAAGFGAGLPGFVARACARAETLRRAIADRRFALAFQPIVSMGDGAAEHYEALLRPDPELTAEFGPPGDFVALAETMGLSEDLDWAVVEAASAAVRRGRGTRVAANLSGLSLQSPAFRARLLDLFDREPMLRARLMVEITETAEIEDEEEAVRTVAALRERGVALCIDDFGAGAAAFRYLRAFRVDLVKIDGNYLRNAMRSEQDRGILASMVGLIRTVGARSVSERIETEAEAGLMRELGVDLGQGWLYGRPGALPC